MMIPLPVFVIAVCFICLENMRYQRDMAPSGSDTLDNVGFISSMLMNLLTMFFAYQLLVTSA